MMRFGYMPIILLCLISLYLVANLSNIQWSYAAYSKAPLAPDGPTVIPSNLAVEKITDKLNFPTSMAFLGPNDILVTEKNTGKVVRIQNGQVQNDPIGCSRSK